MIVKRLDTQENRDYWKHAELVADSVRNSVDTITIPLAEYNELREWYEEIDDWLLIGCWVDKTGMTPRQAIAKGIGVEVTMALDPRISLAALKLIEAHGGIYNPSCEEI